MTTIRELTRSQKSTVLELNLTSTHVDKIYRIQHIERFTQLKSLILANNMIIKIQNLDHLVHLKILNLEFNQIARLEGLEKLHELEELFASYNSIDTITDELSQNQQLKMVHLAYNDLKSINDIQILSSLPQLAVLSVFGNPFLSSLNYITFVKMMIPSLVLLDDKDANEYVISANVYPHQDIIILKEALNKLIDERNLLHKETIKIEQSNLKNDDSSLIKGSPSKLSSQYQQFNSKLITDRQKFLQILDFWLQKIQSKLLKKRSQLNKYSELYSSKLDSLKKKQQQQITDIERFSKIAKKIKRYKEKQKRGDITPEQKQKLTRLEDKLQQRQDYANTFIQQPKDNLDNNNSKNILTLLKIKQQEYSHLKSSQFRVKELKQAVELNEQIQINKILLFRIVFGKTDPGNFEYKELQNYILQQKSLYQITKILKLIIFGEQADTQRIIRLKEFLKEKSLISVINQLKQIRIRQKKQSKKYYSERKKFIDKFETETKELCEEWKKLQYEKRMLEYQQMNKGKQKEDFEAIQSRKKSIFAAHEVEKQQRQMIARLKKQKQHYEQKLNILHLKNEQLNQQFERKYQQLQEFQQYFNDFKKQKEVMNDMKTEIEDIESKIETKHQLLNEITQRLKQMSGKQQLLMDKINHYDRKCFEKSQELKLYEDKIKFITEKMIKINEESNIKNLQILRFEDIINKQASESRQYQKRIQRHKKTLQIYQQKIKNLSQIETTKKSNIKLMQSQIENEKKLYNQLNQRNIEIEQKMGKNIEVSYQYQLKIQQNKKTLQSLTDINKSISDMMQRQSQLKRSIIELEIQNNNLKDIKNQLVNEIKMSYDDQDFTL